MSMFLHSVKALKLALDVPSDMPLAPAIHYMTTIMRLPIKGDDGQLLPLPDQVNQLLAVTGVIVNVEGDVADDSGSGNGPAVPVPVPTSTLKATDLKQSEPPALCLRVCTCL